MPADRNDPEIRAFIRASKAPTHSTIAAEIAERFGAERAWPAELVADVIYETNRSGVGARRTYQDNAEVMAFIADRAGQVPLEEITCLGRAEFGQGRFPSTSTVHRLLRTIRRETAHKARKATHG